MALCRALVMLSFACAVAFPQAQSTSGDVKGAVVDATGAAIAKARLTATDAERGISRGAVTDAQGEFILPLLPPGKYKVRVEAQSFTTKVIDGVEVRVGDVVTLPVDLTVSAIATEIEVQAAIAVVETERTQQANTIEQARIRDLPINRRNYLDFALLAPATSETSSMVDGTDYRVVQTPTSGISFGGGNGRGNGFSIDGVENFYNSGGVRLSVSQEAVQEFQINRSSASAEFGWASGGTINIVTKSGGNEYRGNLFGFLRHRNIQARNFFDPAKSAFTRAQAGATLGGPLQKDKTFFFLAYEHLGRQETSFVPLLQDRSAFTSLTASQQPLVNFLLGSGVPSLVGLGQQARAALTPGNYPFVTNLFNSNTGTFPFSAKANMMSVRLDHHLNERHNLYFRANWATDSSTNAQLGALIAYNRGRNFDNWDGTMMVNHSYVPNTRLVVETRLMYNYNFNKVLTTDPNGPEINVTGFGFFGREIFLPSRNWERHYQVLQNWNLHTSSHDLKWGFDLNPVRDRAQTETFFSGRFSFGEAVPLAQVLIAATGNPNFPAQLAGSLTQLGQASLVPALSAPMSALQSLGLGLPTYYQQGFGDPFWTGWSKRFGVFLQDSWRPKPGLTVSLGLRYDLEVNEQVLGTDKNNFFPRAGFAWSPRKDGKFVVRGGYGFYVTPTNLQIANIADALSGRTINQVFVPLTGITGINNPKTGRPTTSADLWQGLLAGGVIGKRTITPADILPYGVPVGPGLPLRVVFGSEHLRNSYAQQGSLELERSVGEYALSIGYNFNHTLGIPRIMGRNVYYSGVRNAAGIPTFNKYDPSILQQNIFTYDGNQSYHAVFFMVTRRLQKNFALNAHYTLSKAIDDVTDFNSDFSPMDQLNARAERGLSPYHHSHRFVANALIQSAAKNYWLGGWNYSPILSAHSARPFNLLAGVDLNNDNYVTNDRPYPLGRNVGIGPGMVTFDSRLSRRFALGADGRRSLEFIAEGFNLFNHTNFHNVNNTVGNVSAASLGTHITAIKGLPTNMPLAYTSAFDQRQFQFALKLHY